jgi:hypothetical protein
MGGLQAKPLNDALSVDGFTARPQRARGLQHLRQHMLSLPPMLAAIEDLTAARDW